MLHQKWLLVILINHIFIAVKQLTDYLRLIVAIVYMPHLVIYIMGVAGSGKTTIGQKLSFKTGYAFYDADYFHPQKNIDKMKAGQPLTDEDRWPWLDNIHAFVSKQLESTNVILACSALKEVYRQRLSKGIDEQCRWVYLNGNYQTILQRMQSRTGHYMPATLLQSQFDALELPVNKIEVDITMTPGKIVDEIIAKIN
jgi:carbohydrate kinase (thermoresistant glucokinase family)